MRPLTALLLSSAIAITLGSSGNIQAQENNLPPEIQQHLNQSGNSALFPPVQSATSFPDYPGGQTSQPANTTPNGVAPLPPLPAPTGQETIESVASPLSPEEIEQLKEMVNKQQRAASHKPYKTIPKTRSLSVDLSPGASIPVVYTAPNEITTLVFLDSTGKPWTIAAKPRVSNTTIYDVEWIEKSSALVISTTQPYEHGNISVFLQGLVTPVIVKFDNAPIRKRKRVVDMRVDIRVPGRGPNAAPLSYGTPKIALYDDVLQGFLDGIPPSGAQKIEHDKEQSTQIWEYQQALYVRTPLSIRTAFDSSVSSGDGTHVYKIAKTPYVTLSENGQAVTLELNIY